MFKIEITDETADALFRDVLVQDYKRLVQDIQASSIKLSLEKHEQEDLAEWIRYRDAIKVMMKYYFPYEQYLELVGLDGG